MGADWLSTDLWRAHVSWLSPPWVDDTPQRRAHFDAERWMRQLESAHFRAFIFYVKHHDGWTAYPSALAPVQPERDYLGEAVAAARRHGM
jgi:alpha-L-fucosidase